MLIDNDGNEYELSADEFLRLAYEQIVYCTHLEQCLSSKILELHNLLHNYFGDTKFTEAMDLVRKDLSARGIITETPDHKSHSHQVREKFFPNVEYGRSIE